MSDPFLAEIIMFGGNFNPRGWAFCNGQLLPISQNSALFSLLGTVYGGDGRTTFGLPEMRGRVPVHSGNGSAGPGLTPRALGAKSGQETHILTVPEIPSHNHSAATTVHADELPSDTPTASGNMLAEASAGNVYRSTVASTVSLNAAAATTNIGNTGGNLAHNNMQPFIAVNFIIALAGVFPSRS